MTQDDGDEAEEPGLGDSGFPPIERGAAIEGDTDALAAAADTSLDMDGFETGAGFDLDYLPDDLGLDVEVEALEITSSTFDEIDLDEVQKASSAGPGAAIPAVDDSHDLTLELVDEGPPAAPTPASGETGGEAGFPDVAPSGVAGGDVEPAGIVTSGEADGKPKLSGLERLERQRRRSGGQRLVTVVMAVLMLGAGGLAMGYFGVVQIPGITPPDRTRVDVGEPVALPGPQPETPVMSHVVLVDAWREVETPLAWASALREQNPDLLGFVTVVTIGQQRRYALVVGPAYSEAEAGALKGPLETAFVLLRPDPTSWTVREAPYSFFFGEYEEVQPANSRVQGLATLSVPAFVLRVDYSDGATAFRV